MSTMGYAAEYVSYEAAAASAGHLNLLLVGAGLIPLVMLLTMVVFL